MTTAIGTVKDQVASWGGRRAPKDADRPQRETFGHRALKVVASVGRSQFVTLPDGREVKLRGPVMPHELERAPDDWIIVTRPARTDDGRAITELFIGPVVEGGTGKKLGRRKQYRPKERRPGPIDGLAELRKPAARLPVQLGKDADGPMDIIRGAMSKRPMLLVTDGADMPLTIAGLIEVVNAAGANLRHYNGHTLADWSAVGRWRALLVAAWPLVDAHLAGTPLGCAYEHEGAAPLADTLTPDGKTPVCNQHVGLGPRAA